ncbi:hypothetical protein DEU50_11172 [Aeromonas salmonicida]|uniref:Uncharacterized protein n=1 Tax=Aeromonas salmonicida TaxID=645 RepID=A0AAX1PGR7_AERSA|nr:hypothetical protein DEU50_11172 [Aeromonas salmonicida]
MLPKQGMGALSDDTIRVEQVFSPRADSRSGIAQKQTPFESKGVFGSAIGSWTGAETTYGYWEAHPPGQAENPPSMVRLAPVI